MMSRKRSGRIVPDRILDRRSGCERMTRSAWSAILAVAALAAATDARAGGLFLYEMDALNARATVGAAYEYLNLGDADLDRNRGPLAGRIQGDYSTNEIHFFNAALSWTF